MKETIKKILKALPFAFTQNQRYDRLTRQVIRKVCRPGSNTLDVGCHKGEILDLFLLAAPQGMHYGFEPIQICFRLCKPNTAYTRIAVSSTSRFPIKKEKPVSTTSSAILRTADCRNAEYDRPNETDTLITVRTERLDDVLPPDFQVDMLKIDVEGGELLVLEGARATLRRCKPVVIFEHGLGASEMYGSTPDKVFDLLQDCGLRVSLLDRFLRDAAPMSRESFSREYHERGIIILWRIEYSASKAEQFYKVLIAFCQGSSRPNSTPYFVDPRNQVLIFRCTAAYFLPGAQARNQSGIIGLTRFDFYCFNFATLFYQ